MEQINLPSGEDFEDYCLRTFECFLQGDLFPYSLKETYRLAFASWDEAVNELMEIGVEGFSYQKNPDADDYQMCMQGFTHHVLMRDKSLNNRESMFSILLNTVVFVVVIIVVHFKLINLN